MTWHPVSKRELLKDIESSIVRMTHEQRRLWEMVSVPPSKWEQSPWGEEGGGFWVVALMGSKVIWFNDIEDGYNLSSYCEFGVIDEYWCNQDQLEWAVQKVIELLQGDESVGFYRAPPKPVT